MFKLHRQTQGEGGVKKSILKLLDPKKDVLTRFKHLKNIILNSQESEVHSIFHQHHSHIYFIVFESFLLAESNLRQKGSHKAQREELDAVLEVFEQILINLPELIHQRWQYHSIDMIIKRLLHSQNSLKVRREGMNFFLMWIMTLRENVLPQTLLLYACLVPGFPPPTSGDDQPYSLEWLVNMPFNEEYGVHQVEITCLVPPSSGEKNPNDLTKYFLDTLLESMVLKSNILRWKNPANMAKKCFSFLWDLFKEYYIPQAFPDFDKSTSIYNPVLSLPEPRESVNYVLNVSDSGSLDPHIEVTSGCQMFSSRVSIIKWIVNFTGSLDRTDTLVKRPDAAVEALHRQVLRQLQETYVSSNSEKVSESHDGKHLSNSNPTVVPLPQHIGITSVYQQDTETTNSNTSTLTEKEPSISSLSSLDDRLQSSASATKSLVQNVLYSSRQNIDFVHEMFRQAFMLPLTEVPIMRRVVKVYQEWIQDGDMPPFMEEDEKEQPTEETNSNDSLSSYTSANSIRNVSYVRGQQNPVIEENQSSQVRTGIQSTLQLFVTNSAHVFLVEPPSNATKLIEAQVDVCKRVLNLYRYMVMNGHLSEVTWRQLLRVLVHVTRSMLQDPMDDEPDINRFNTVTGKLAGPIFQTLIVSWIKANLFVYVSRELWDELVDVLSSLTHWDVLITEWAKNMETMTRVLARHVYRLELQDLPLDRLTELKHKKHKNVVHRLNKSKKGKLFSSPGHPERSFSRGWSRDSSSLVSSNIPENNPTCRKSQSALTTGTQNPETSTNCSVESVASGSTSLSALEKPPDKISSQRVTSDTDILYNSNHSTSVQTNKRRNSASDVECKVNEDVTQSPTRQRCESEGVNGNDKNTELDQNSLSINLQVAWKEPAQEICEYARSQDGDEDTNLSVHSVEADDMFDELAHERLHADFPEKDTVSDETWPNDITSLHSHDSASIDPEWNPWSDKQPTTNSHSEQELTATHESLSMDVKIFDETPQDESPTLFDSFARANAAQQHSATVVGLPPNVIMSSCDSSETQTTMSPTPPAIPARVALPTKPLTLLEIDYLSTHSDSSDRTSPSQSGGGGGDFASASVISPSNIASPAAVSDPTKAGRHHLLLGSSSTPKNSVQTDGARGSPESASLSEEYFETKDLQQTESFVSENQGEVSHLNEMKDAVEMIHSEPNLSLSKDSGSVADTGSVEANEVDMDITPGSDLSTSVVHSSRIETLNCSTPSQGTSKSFEESLNDTSFEGEFGRRDQKVANSNDCSIMAGGQRTGWYADVAVALWRRLIGILGDINEIKVPEIHEDVFKNLLDFWNILFKMRQNLGLSGENQPQEDASAPPVQYVPPLRITAPWGFKATMSLPESHKGGKLHAYNLLCKMTVQREHDVPLESDHLAQFYLTLHDGLHSSDPDIVSEIVESCAQYFSSCLPGSSLLLLDFIYACHSVAASSNLQAPRVEAQTILGSSLCLPNIYHDVPVLKPDSAEPLATECNNVKDYVVDALLTSGKKEPSASARCVALSSTGVWLYEELTNPKSERHSRLKEAINVLLVTLKFNNRIVACVACNQLHLLTHCSEELLKTMPDMPPRIIEVMSLSVSALLNDTEAKNTDSGRQLLVNLLLCILDWCMSVPLQLLINTYGANTDKRLIRTVFKAMQTAALGKPGHSAKHSYSLSDLASTDFDPNLPLDKVLESPSVLTAARPKPFPRNNPQSKLGKSGAVSLVAHTVLTHLNNHLGHFPLARGTSVLTCRVSEHHDIENANDELSPDLFQSPNVQFLIFNDSCLLSVVELPSQEESAPGSNPTAGLTTSSRCVRFIVRDAGGKYCWESSVLYGPPDLDNIIKPVRCTPNSALDDEISRTAKETCQAFIEYSQQQEKTEHKVTPTSLPQFDDESQSADKLDQLLQYLGYSSPECQFVAGNPLNMAAPPPSCISPELQEKATQCLLRHHEELGASYEQNSRASSWQCNPVRPRDKVTSNSPFHHARMLCVEMGFLARDKRDRVSFLNKNERLLRELKNLDSRRCRETHKVAVLYIAQGQEDKLSILSNAAGSKEFEDFVAGLGWEVDLSLHCGFRGKLQSDGSNGSTAPYYATSTVEILFHVSTRFPTTDDAAKNVKLKHLGNDEVHIVWSDHHRDYRRGIIPTEFGDVIIAIYPIRHGLFRVQINKKPDVPYFGPLFDGAIVNGRVLPVLVRETAINAGRAKRSQIPLYQPYYEERTRYLREIIDQFKDETTYENFTANLFCPAPQNRSQTNSNVQPRIAPKTTSTGESVNSNNNNNNQSSNNKVFSNVRAPTLTLPLDAIQSDNSFSGSESLSSTTRTAPPASHSITGPNLPSTGDLSKSPLTGHNGKRP